jgi:hypothetical protein
MTITASQIDVHAIDLDVKFVSMSYAGSTIMSHTEYRWLCSCGEHGDWFRDVREARNSVARHTKEIAP